MTKLRQISDFSGRSIYVGIDVHKANWDVSIFFEKEYIRSFHQRSDPQILVTTLKRDYPNAEINCAYETGFSGFWLQRFLMGEGINCIVVNAADIPQTDKGRKTKTDRRDSVRIAQSLEARQIHGIYIPDESYEADRRVVRYRTQVLQDLTRSKNRIKHLFYTHGIQIPEKFSKNNWSIDFIKWIKSLQPASESLKFTIDIMLNQIQMLQQELKGLNQKVIQMLKSERYRSTAELLLSVPGIGRVITITLLVEINDINRFSSFNKLNSYIGLCPGEHSSGETEIKGNLISRHHKILRALFIEAAWIGVRKDPALLLAFSDLKKKMTAKRAIIRIARKLLNRVYHVWKKMEQYENGILK